MAALNQERFTLATDNTIGDLRNGAKNINTRKSISFWLSVWKMWCEGKSIALEIKEQEPAELNRLLEKLYAEVRNKYDLPALPPHKIFILILLISNHMVFLFQFGINLHL